MIVLARLLPVCATLLLVVPITTPATADPCVDDAGDLWWTAAWIPRPFACQDNTVNSAVDPANCRPWTHCPDTDWFRTDGQIGLSDTLAVRVCHTGAVGSPVPAGSVSVDIMVGNGDQAPVHHVNFARVTWETCRTLTTTHMMVGQDWFIHVYTGGMYIQKYSISVFTGDPTWPPVV